MLLFHTFCAHFSTMLSLEVWRSARGWSGYGDGKVDVDMYTTYHTNIQHHILNRLQNMDGSLVKPYCLHCLAVLFHRQFNYIIVVHARFSILNLQVEWWFRYIIVARVGKIDNKYVTFQTNQTLLQAGWFKLQRKIADINTEPERNTDHDVSCCWLDVITRKYQLRWITIGLMHYTVQLIMTNKMKNVFIIEATSIKVACPSYLRK